MHTARTIGQPPRRQNPPQRPSRVPTICVVDPDSGSCQSWAETHRNNAFQIEFVPSAEAALRRSRTQAIDLWLVNVDLPNLSGYELCGMLKAKNSRTPVHLMADEYSPEAERAAWAARATSFTCKPGHHAWLDDWLRQAAASTR